MVLRSACSAALSVSAARSFVFRCWSGCSATRPAEANLQRGATYKATVATAVKELAGNALDQSPTTTGNQPKTWTFTVAN